VNKPRRRTESLIVREMNGEFLLLDTAANQVHRLNRTASVIWRCCDGTSSPQQIAAVMMQTFDVEGSLVLLDVIRTLAQLRALNLLVQV
jgi:hypothetical protein